LSSFIFCRYLIMTWQSSNFIYVCMHSKH
jgi:hypothetical protein